MNNDIAVFVYYKIPLKERQYYVAAVEQLKDAISQRYPSLQMAHYKRPDIDGDQRETWMETYHGLSVEQNALFKIELAMLAKACGMLAERKYEVFKVL